MGYDYRVHSGTVESHTHGYLLYNAESGIRPGSPGAVMGFKSDENPFPQSGGLDQNTLGSSYLAGSFTCTFTHVSQS
jgi:hypothetical protein